MGEGKSAQAQGECPPVEGVQEPGQEDRFQIHQALHLAQGGFH